MQQQFNEDQYNDIVSSDETTTPVVTEHKKDRNDAVNIARNGSACSKSPLRLIPYLSTKEGPFQASH